MIGASLEGLQGRFEALGALLAEHAALWRPRPFEQLPAPWEAAHPDWMAHLGALPEAVATGVGAGDTRWLDGAPASLSALHARVEALCELPLLPSESLAEALEPAALSARAVRGVPGRKLAQIRAFLGVLLAHQGAQGPLSGGPVVDWCAGKSHLGRTVCRHTGAPLLALEIDAALVEAGAALSAAAGLRAEHRVQDVLATAPPPALPPEATIIALHACGELHGALIEAAIAGEARAVALAPCCYNRLRPGGLGPVRSAAGRAQGLQLSADDLGLLHREAVVAGSTDRRRLATNLSRRLGFDLWQRAASGRDAYRSVPPFPDAWLERPFAEFCAAVVERMAPEDPIAPLAGALRAALAAGKPAPEPFEAQGELRRVEVARREVVRRIFAAPLERWLLLDRALRLAEGGFAVAVGAFCARDVTPRNGILLAHRPGGPGKRPDPPALA